MNNYYGNLVKRNANRINDITKRIKFYERVLWAFYEKKGIAASLWSIPKNKKLGIPFPVQIESEIDNLRKIIVDRLDNESELIKKALKKRNKKEEETKLPRVIRRLEFPISKNLRLDKWLKKLPPPIKYPFLAIPPKVQEKWQAYFADFPGTILEKMQLINDELSLTGIDWFDKEKADFIGITPRTYINYKKKLRVTVN